MPTELIALAAPVIFLAYSVFGMTGFGAAMVAIPVLVQLMPLQHAVPMVVLFDLACTGLVGVKNWRRVSVPELARVLPWMILGIALGATLLSKLPPKWPLIALGVFVLIMCVRNLQAAASGRVAPLRPFWAIPFGALGGVFSALFGTGGPIYTIYLSRRLPDVDQFRASISVIIFLSSVSRALVFGASGAYAEHSILMVAGMLLPVALLGVLVGSKVRTRVSQAMLKRFIVVLLAASGVAVLYKGLILPM
ncbi:sulfite exporter TauE/SafE family protein [Diaphorobacter sp. HDW4A]|uniref:sulfite exporter TauE/SafE family protein n=1 Tax=Diaphorobacter sp. HDW4A TaxID=2714924 RepID=UPI00140D1B5B|nr:sulfite exporter TauE/SafE family protein [Diaphorobacter sp. HDW4A]QIL81178.1 sulfite exporter TauE/SafE family protein [Diaphorobacter sp. HDW4A]